MFNNHREKYIRYMYFDCIESLIPMVVEKLVGNEWSKSLQI